MKKLMAALLVGTMVFSLSACGSKDTASTDAQTEAATDAAEEGSEATDAAEDAESTGGTLVMATNAEFPPYEYYEGGEVVGIDADIAQAIADELGMELQIDDMAFDSIIAAVQTGKADFGAAGMTVTEDRLQNVSFSDTYAEAKQVIIVKEGSDIQSADDLNGKTVGVQLGTTGDILADDIEDGTVERYNKGAEAVLALTQDKIDAVIIDSEPAKVFVSENEGLTTIDDAYEVEEYAIAVAKDNTELLDQINEAIANLKESGKLQEIIDKYISAE
jgi:polar amino acid transport system substrate-binding protein